MKRFILLFIFICGFLFSNNLFAGDGKATNDELLRKSQLTDFSNGGSTGPLSSYPYPFVTTGDPITNPRTSGAISTGYYFVQNGDPAAMPWRPEYTLVDTTDDALNWKRILSGPNQRDTAEWRVEGAWRFFRDPNDADIFNGTDSTDNAIAGPMPIGFKFKFNGLDFDSFYVATNGGIILGNDRYQYESYQFDPMAPIYDKTRKLVDQTWYGGYSAYNTNSGDWFTSGRSTHTTDGMSDAVVDDWGWQCAKTAANMGTTNPASIAVGGQPIAMIAPCWGDGYLRQWDQGQDDRGPKDQGRVYYYRDPQGNKLIVYFVEWQLINSIETPYFTNYMPGGSNGADTLEANENNYVTCNVQVVLDRRDNSITFNYERFRGRAESWYLFEARHVIRSSTYSGVFGFARNLAYDSKQYRLLGDSYTGTIPWATTNGQYPQSTYAWAHYKDSDPAAQYPNNTQSLKFKQWKNTLRVCDLAFRVRKQEEGAEDFTEKVLTNSVNDYEILAGHEQIGQIQPVAIVENVSNDWQSPSQPNYQPQDLNFRVRCSIINQATRRALYNKYVKVDSLAIAKKDGDNAYEKIIAATVKRPSVSSDYEADTMNTLYYDGTNHLKPIWNGIPPYGFVQVYFPPFEPNELFTTHIGLMRAFLMVDPTDPRTGEGFEDMWPFDDTLNIRFWVMRHIPSTESFTDDVSEYHMVPNDPDPNKPNQAAIPIPSVFKWVSVGALVISGESVSRNPLPPRGDFLVDNDELFPGSTVSSPCIKLQRPPSVGYQAYGGYEMRSFPIDLFGKPGSILTMSIQRSTDRPDWERGYSDGSLIGCEHRVVVSQWYNDGGRIFDVINVEFARPSPKWQDGTYISNIAKDNWRWHLRRGGAQPEKKMPAYQLFGGGGYMVGFLETDKDSALPPPVFTAVGRAENGLRYNYYDDGIDFEYRKVFIPIPDTIINAPAEGAKYFRFRIQVYAQNHQINAQTIADDEDPFYVDNIRILYATEEDVDVEMTKVAAEWPYTMAPASQAVSVPIRMQLSNNTSRQAPSFWVKTMIVTKSDFNAMYFLDNAWVYRGDPSDPDYQDMVDLFKARNQMSRDSARWVLLHTRPIYCRTKQLPFLRPGSNEPITMPNWNARLSPDGDYVVIGVVYIPGKDLEPKNDTTFSPVTIKFGPIYAYHPITNQSNFRMASNGVPSLSGDYGRGLNLLGYKMGGVGSYAKDWAYGDFTGGSSGQIAAKFEIFQEDTIFGYGAYFSQRNQHPDYVTYRMFDGTNTPSNEIPGSLVQTQRGWDQILDSTLWAQFVFTMLPKPIVLPQGTYWVSIAQLGETGIELGASKSKCGMRCTNVYFHNPQTPDKNGSAGYYLNIEKTFRQREKYGNLINYNFFAFENGLGSGAWEQFTPTIGNPSYAHLEHRGPSPVDNTTLTLTRASWMPLLVPYLGDRLFATEPDYLECEIPVELTYFKGSVRENAIDLLWETASELNNFGFNVERKVVGDENAQWNTLSGFVKGNGTSNMPHEYNYVDENVVPNTTYQYKLRQIDLDGTQSCDDFSNIVTLTYTLKGAVSLMPNTPNPFSDGTTLNFSIPENAHVTLDVLDVYGNVVRTLVDSELAAGPKKEVWDANDSNGMKVATGTYIYRLKVGDNVLTGKMSLVK